MSALIAPFSEQPRAHRGVLFGTPAHALWLRVLRFGGVLGTLLFTAYAIDYLDIDLDRLAGMLGRIGVVLATRYYPPNIDHVLAPDYLHSVLETLQMSYAATVLGLLCAVPLAWCASSNLTPDRRFLQPLARFIIIAARSVHEMIWTILLVSLIGFGMLPGTIALMFFCIGFSGKLFTEALESISPGPVDATRATGARKLQVLFVAAWPQVQVAWTGIAIYTWDAVFRAATVVGFFGAGGMGWYLRESTQLIASRDVAAILLSIILVVAISEIASAWLRHRIAHAVA